MTTKLAWRDVYKDFRSRYPNLRNKVLGYLPYDYLTIKLMLDDGSYMTYSYVTKQCEFINK